MVAAAGCDGGASADLGPPEPERERIEEHIRVLADEIGVRVAGSPEEQAAIDSARRQLEGWRYEVEVQAFPVSSDLLRGASLTVEGPERRQVEALPFVGAASGDVTAMLADAGTGREEDFPPETEGALVLIQRRDVFFTDMARRARDAGALAVVLANSEPELFQGGFRDPLDLPFIAISQTEGEALRALLARGPVEVRVDVEERRRVTAHNVVARPEGEDECRTVTGGHYDSVPVARGANDNASGAGTVLELARAAAASGLEGHCFVLFGAEETGLDGSKFFVSELSEEERDGLIAMFNYDAVGGEGRPQLIGSRQLAERAQELAKREGVEVERSVLPAGASSDHASFLDARIPSLMFSTPDLKSIHTAQDTLENLNPVFLDEIATLGFALLEQILQD